MDVINRIYRNALYSFKGLHGFLKPQIYLLVRIINPVFQILFFSLIARHAYGNKDITPYIIGNAFVLCTSTAFFGVGCNLIAERSYGTLKLIIGSSCNKFSFFTTKSIFHILDGAITVVIGLIAGIVFFHITIPFNQIPILALCLLSAMFTACSMGLFIGSIGLVTRDINLLLNLSSMILMALCGVNFPIEKLPYSLQYLSNILPLTNALKACRLLISDGMLNLNTIYFLIFKELSLGIIYCIIAYLALKLMERLAKCRATVDIY